MELHYQRNYGITLEDKKKIAEDQDNRCKICLCTFPLHIDHNHGTGEIRGLLCRECNLGLGLLGDSIPILRNCIQYLSDN